jgi:hypothetical protein
MTIEERIQKMRDNDHNDEAYIFTTKEELDGHRIESNIAGTDDRWSGDIEVPEVGDRVVVAVNRIGPGTVVGYCVMDNWIGVIVDVDDPPPWLVESHKRYDMDLSVAYGIEVRKP